MSNKNIVELKNIRKVFGEVVALDNIDFSIEKGKIHGLLGENGAGKSTLMNILYGLYLPDNGTIIIDGKKVKITSPYTSIKYGIGMVHQVSTLVGEFTAVENIILGTKGEMFRLSLEKEAKKIKDLSEEFGLPFPLSVKVKELSSGIKQKIEIIRSLYRNVRLLILDEPTTSLVQSEFQQLLKSLQILVKRGVTVVFITHKIKEVMEACDTVTVLRKGTVQGSLIHEEMTKENLVKLMFIEKDIEVTESALPAVILPKQKKSPKPVLEFKNVSIPGGDKSVGLKNISFELYGGEILGVAAVSGNGEKELAETSVHTERMSEGDILLEGKSISNLSTLEIFKKGIAYTPEDRIREGILPEGSITENIVLGHQTEERFLKRGVFINWDQVREAAKKTIKDYNIYTPGEDLAVRRLSGGNIQKAIIGRAYVSPVKALITHNPTSGLDISTVEFIFEKLVETRSKGGAVLWINEDLDELMILSDRIAVLHRGELRKIFLRNEFDKYKIGLLMIGG
ncbi:MAG: ABC transporter ATP-binding protein [Spirochaetales bacterium]|nr:ABC transporter ATP-binding protein [Spirochaetales bacterium]